MANAPVMAVEGLGVDSVELPHPTRKRWIDRFDKQVIVVGHQAVRMAEPVATIANLESKFKECVPIRVIKEDAPSFIPTTGDVVNTWVLDS